MRIPIGFKLVVTFLIVAALSLPNLADAQIWLTIRDVAPECAQSVPNLISQWRANAQRGNIKRESPLYALQAGDTPAALKYLKQGQRHNTTVVQLYQSCADATSIQYILLLAASSADGACDLADAKLNLVSQKRTNPVSLNEAYRIWDVVRREYPATQDSAVMGAVFKLYEGQRDNADALNEYRACFRDRAVDLFNLVREVITTP